MIVTGADTPPPLVSRAVTAGARGFLLKPFAPTDLATAIHDVYESHLDLRRLQRSDRAAGTTVAQRGSLIAVYSPKGGVGCTTIATNLAAALSVGTKAPVGLVDLDLQFGDVGIAMDLRGTSSIIDLLDHDGPIDAALVDDIFVRHPSGVRALLAPDNLGALQTIDPDRIVAATDALRDHFRYVVCDMWSSFEDLTLAMLRAADRVILVTTPELPALKNVRRVLLATTPLLADDRTLIVVNRHPGKAGIPLSDIERALGRPVAMTIPSEGVGITEAINQGISLFDARARTGARASRSVAKLAQLVGKASERRPVVKAASSSPSAA